MAQSRVTFCIFLFFMSAVILIAQENPQPKFEIGGIVSYTPRADTTLLQTYLASGMNTIVVHSGSDNKDMLSHFNVIPINGAENEWIHYYATGYYSKWEAEDKIDTPYVGVKHLFGDTATWRGKKCWSTIGVTAPTCSLMYGPHYMQWKFYKRWGGTDPVNFIPRYNMALVNDGQPPNTDVCKITVSSSVTQIYSFMVPGTVQ